MTKFIALFLLIIIVSSCGSLKKLEIATIKKVYLEHNPIEPLNYGNKFEGKIVAVLKDGEEIEITSNRNLSINSNDIVKRTGGKFDIIKHPKQFDDHYLRMSYTITEKDQATTFGDSLMLNLRGDLKIDARGTNGTNGETQKNRNAPLLFRDGRDGENGTDGAPGRSAENYISYVWKEQNFYYIYVQNITSKVEWRYASIDPTAIKFDLSGGDGGNGGRGGNGSDGKDGIIQGGKSKTPGKGGDAGFGGNGGAGGNGGSIVIFLHENASEIKDKIEFNLSGGQGGQGGAKGKPGQPGKPIAGQKENYPGKTARNGRPGIDGIDGQVPEIAVQSFDFSSYK